jgi:V8-like Glu-specific endopeptidase
MGAWTASAWAAEQNFISLENPAPLERSGRPAWTDKDFREAIPAPVPTATEPAEGKTLGRRSLKTVPGKEAVEPAQLPPSAIEEVPELKTRLFPGGEDKSGTRRGGSLAPKMETHQAGTAQAPFSSSRLIPQEARLTYPYRAAGKLFYKSADGKSWVCSGAVIAPRLVLTAGHCVHEGKGAAEGFHRDFVFVPAYYYGEAPLGAWSFSWVVTTEEWSNSDGAVPNQADFAILEMRDIKTAKAGVIKLGNQTGWFGLGVPGNWPNHTKRLGYPVGFDQGQEMHQVDSQSAGADTEFSVVYGSDMNGGSSGGPIIQNFGAVSVGEEIEGLNLIVGVTSYGPKDTTVKTQGSSVFTQELLDIYKAACQHQAGNCPGQFLSSKSAAQ